MSWYRREPDGVLLLRLRIQPKASRDELCGAYGDDALKVRITAPPVDGQANAHLVKYLAKLFKVAKSNVTLVSGETGRDKSLRIVGSAVDPESLLA